MAYKVAVIVDGPGSPSHASAEAVCATLESAGHQVLVLEIGPELVQALRAEKPQVAYISASLGAPGEVQSLLELLDIPFIGSESAAIRRACDDRAVATAIASYYAGFDGCASVPASVLLSKGLIESVDARDLLGVVAERIPGGFPLVARPASAGASVAPLKVSNLEELVTATENLMGLCDEVAIQEWLEGVMLSVAVLGEAGDPYALPPVEIGVSDAGDAELYAPVRLESLSQDESMAHAIRSEVERAAAEAYAALGCRDLGLVDILWDGARAKVLRVDTAPAMDARSLFLMSCRVADLGGSALFEELLEQAVYRA